METRTGAWEHSFKEGYNVYNVVLIGGVLTLTGVQLVRNYTKIGALVFEVPEKANLLLSQLRQVYGTAADDYFSYLRSNYVKLKEVLRGVSGAGRFFNIGDNIAGKVVQRVLPGSNGKVAIVGRKMAGHVEDAATTSRAEGKQVEIFSELDQKNNLFNINGSNKSWQDIVDDFGNKNGQYLTNEKGWILDSELPKTMMYKANKIWADKLKAQGYTVIDTGYPAGANLPESVFYNMEISTLFP